MSVHSVFRHPCNPRALIVVKLLRLTLCCLCLAPELFRSSNLNRNWSSNSGSVSSNTLLFANAEPFSTTKAPEAWDRQDVLDFVYSLKSHLSDSDYRAVRDAFEGYKLDGKNLMQYYRGEQVKGGMSGFWQIGLASVQLRSVVHRELLRFVDPQEYSRLMSSSSPGAAQAPASWVSTMSPFALMKSIVSWAWWLTTLLFESVGLLTLIATGAEVAVAHTLAEVHVSFRARTALFWDILFVDSVNVLAPTHPLRSYPWILQQLVLTWPVRLILATFGTFFVVVPVYLFLLSRALLSRVLVLTQQLVLYGATILVVYYIAPAHAWNAYLWLIWRVGDVGALYAAYLVWSVVRSLTGGGGGGSGGPASASASVSG